MSRLHPVALALVVIVASGLGFVSGRASVSPAVSVAASADEPAFNATFDTDTGEVDELQDRVEDLESELATKDAAIAEKDLALADISMKLSSVRDRLDDNEWNSFQRYTGTGSTNDLLRSLDDEENRDEVEDAISDADSAALE